MAGESRRKQLIEVAIDLFSKKGFSGTTTKEIAASAGVTEAVIFRHFATKEQLYQAIIDFRVGASGTSQRFAEMKAFMDANDDEQFFRSLLQAVIEIHRQDQKFERLMLYAALEGNELALLYKRTLKEPVLDAFLSYIQRRQNEGAFRPGNPWGLLMSVVGMAQHFATSKYIYGFCDPQIDDAEMVQFFLRVALDGIRTSKEVEL
jgi:TetR/AcrR family transcriptional regulator